MTGTGFGVRPAGRRGKSPVPSFMEDSVDYDILSEDWTTWLPRLVH